MRGLRFETLMSRNLNPNHDAWDEAESRNTLISGSSQYIFENPSSSRPVIIGSARFSHSTVRNGPTAVSLSPVNFAGIVTPRTLYHLPASHSISFIYTPNTVTTGSPFSLKPGGSNASSCFPLDKKET